MKVLVERKFSIYSKFLDTTLQSEDEIQEGESRKDALKRLHRELGETAFELRKEAESIRGSITTEITQGVIGDFPPIGPPNPMPIISKDIERLEIAIDNAESPEELQKIKADNPVMPFPILKLWDKKMEELTKNI